METIYRREYPDAERIAAQETAISCVEHHASDLLRDYKVDPRSFGGRYVCADLAKDIFPEYSASRESRGREQLVSTGPVCASDCAWPREARSAARAASNKPATPTSSKPRAKLLP